MGPDFCGADICINSCYAHSFSNGLAAVLGNKVEVNTITGLPLTPPRSTVVPRCIILFAIGIRSISSAISYNAGWPVRLRPESPLEAPRGRGLGSLYSSTGRDAGSADRGWGFHGAAKWRRGDPNPGLVTERQRRRLQQRDAAQQLRARGRGAGIIDARDNNIL
ncbi:hypothetical protein BDV24DRAFT_164443 [Aspergillus arachidicola]|uniref:Uncharacterized protein n=1 Tax=Aspergillus arachidicola TaxID=656916 RepID=A0A5N6YA05_9EURO|nr:hypothetical protein BDV24DRAFT_164443 [Aspergillus arachidicola]